MAIFGLILGALMTVVVYCAYILIISFTLWMAIDAGKQDRFWWLTLIIGIPVIGSAAYFFTEKKHVYAEAPSHHIHTSQTEIEHENSHKKNAKHDKQDGESLVKVEEKNAEEVMKEEKSH